MASSQTATAVASVLLLLLAQRLHCHFRGASRPSPRTSAASTRSRRRSSATRSRRATSRPQTLYNFGTALVAGDSVKPARRSARAASSTTRTTIYASAGCSISGLAHLKPGLAAPAGQDNGELDSTLAVYKKALLMHPGDLDAKWNYELALRKKQRAAVAAAVVEAARATSRHRDRRRSHRAASGNNRPSSCSAARRARSVTCSRRSKSRTRSSPRREERTGDRRARSFRAARDRHARARDVASTCDAIEFSVAISAPGRRSAGDRSSVAGAVRRAALVGRTSPDVRSSRHGVDPRRIPLRDHDGSDRHVRDSLVRGATRERRGAVAACRDFRAGCGVAAACRPSWLARASTRVSPSTSASSRCRKRSSSASRRTTRSQYS